MLANETDSDPELALLGGNLDDNDFNLTGEANHALRTAPIFTGDAYEAVGSTIFPQRALYGRILESSTGAQIKSPKLFININAPFSGIVCGVQVRRILLGGVDHKSCAIYISLSSIGLWKEPFYVCSP
jgi:hypothetical protein